MNDPDADNNDPNQREWDRLSVRTRMLLEFESGDILIGESDDVSLRGVLMQVDLVPPQEMLGALGTLYLVGRDGQPSDGYPCKVVRLKGNSVALELDAKVAAAFANRITRGLLRR
jgi:hypothetical protein